MENLIICFKKSTAKDLKPHIEYLKYTMGMEGYGIYCELKERVRKNKKLLPIKDLRLLAHEIEVPYYKLLSVIVDYNLFGVQRNSF